MNAITRCCANCVSFEDGMCQNAVSFLDPVTRKPLRRKPESDVCHDHEPKPPRVYVAGGKLRIDYGRH